MSWFEQTRTDFLAGRLQQSGGLMTWGRGMFARNFAEGGFASRVFSPGGVRPWGRARAGGTRYRQNLMAMKAASPRHTKKIDKLLAAEPKRAAGSILGGVGRVGLAGAFLAMPAIMTEGTAGDRATAMVAGAVGWGGWEIGSKAGMAAGASIGSVVPVLGTAIGAVAGYLAGGFAGSIGAEKLVYGVKGEMDRIAAEGKRRRTFTGWYGDTAAFDTQKAATMRQMSLQMMNQGMMTARSGLGHEGVMMHR